MYSSCLPQSSVSLASPAHISVAAEYSCTLSFPCCACIEIWHNFTGEALSHSYPAPERMWNSFLRLIREVIGRRFRLVQKAGLEPTHTSHEIRVPSSGGLHRKTSQTAIAIMRFLHFAAVLQISGIGTKRDSKGKGRRSLRAVLHTVPELLGRLARNIFRLPS